MKKYLFLASVAALSFTACTNETEEFTGTGSADQQKEIAFFPLNSIATRSASDAAVYNAVSDDKYPQNYNMEIVAYSVPKTSDDGVAGNYFGGTSGQEFQYQVRTSNGYWAGTTAQYWPLAQVSLNFLAVSYKGSPDANKVTPTFSTPNWASGVSVALADNQPADANSGAKKGQHDLMYAYGRGTVTKSGNAIIMPEKVDMAFNHALAWVYFRIKGDEAAASKIVIESITLKNAYYAGTFTAALTNYDSYDAALSWTAANTKWTAATTQHDVASPNQTINADGDGNSTNESQALTTSFAPVGDGILVVPTDEITPATVSFDTFVIKYWMNGASYSYTYTPATNADKTLSKGKKYIYDITMKLSEIFVNASVEEWTDGGTTYVDVPTTTYAYSEAATAGTYNVAKGAGTYTVYISNFAAASTDYDVTVVGDGDTSYLTVTSASVTTDANKGAVITFKVANNTTGAARTNASIKVKKHDADTYTTIGVNQAGS